LPAIAGGDTWEGPFTTEFVSPLSPMSIKRIPSTGDLVALWNDHSRRFPFDRADPGRQLDTLRVRRLTVGDFYT